MGPAVDHDLRRRADGDRHLAGRGPPTRGKKLAVSQWGGWGVQGFTGSADKKGDDPVYVQNMYDFFNAHADAIAYENYYGRPALHRLFPTTVFPRSSALYRQLWSAGQ